MPGEKILIVDDEIEISELIRLYLVKNGFNVITAVSGCEALQMVETQQPDLIILDILLPDFDGIELCQELRKKIEIPIIFLSCKNDDIDKILGLTVGGDDYITKPFSPGELVARVKAHLRRNRLLEVKKDTNNDTLNYPGFSIDFSSHTIYIDEKPLTLPSKEYDLLVLLAQNPNMVLSLAQLYDCIWGVDNFGDTRTVMVHISNLRKKIEKDPSNPQLIITIKGAGYKFNPPKKEQ